MEKKDFLATTPYPVQTAAPPAGFTLATQYPVKSAHITVTSTNFTPAQVVISAQPPIQPTTSQSYNPRYPPQYVEEPTGCCNANQKNRPQTNSVAAASLIFISGGMNIAWSCFYTGYLSFNMTTHLRICWFLAAIIGALSSALITSYMPKKPIFLFSSILVIVGGALLIALPHNPAAVASALYMDGIANGIAIVPALVMVGEEAIPGLRGRTASTLEIVCFTCGMFLQIIIVTSFDIANVQHSSFGATEIRGLLSIIFGLAAFLTAAFLAIESPVYYLQRDDEDSAINSLRRLQRPFFVKHETYRLLDEQKSYVSANRLDPYLGLSALLKLCIYRGLSALAFSRFTSYTLSITSFYTIGIWPYVSSGFLLWFSALITGSFVDSVGRKKPMLLGALICGGMAIGIGVIYQDEMNFYYNRNIDTAMYLFLIMQFCAGLFISAAPVYTTEAFPLRFKPYYVALAFIVQMLVHIILGTCDLKLDGISTYFITWGALCLVYFLFGLVAMPETKNDTLREAQDKFKNLLSTRARYI